MIQLIIGAKGAGKTKKIIDRANLQADTAKGNIIFIDDDKRYMFDLTHKIRFIDASEYDIDSPKMFYGFLCGLAAQDFDLETIYIDGFLRIVKYDIDKMPEFFDHLKSLCEKSNIKIVASVSVSNEKLPPFLKEYV